MSKRFSRVLITGASGGIGSALALAIDAQGVGHMILVGRRIDPLNDLTGRLTCDVTTVIADLSSKDGVAQVLAQAGETDLLVNCAGFGSFGPFAETDGGTQESMVMVNCYAPVALTRALLPKMVAAGRGCVVNVASGMSFQPMPYMSTYAASKAFLLHWSEGIAQELLGTGVTAVAVCPGTVHTGFAAAGAIPIDRITGVNLITVSVEEVVQDTLDAIERSRQVIAPGLGNRLATALGRIFPRWVVRWVLGRSMAREYRRVSG